MHNKTFHSNMTTLAKAIGGLDAITTLNATSIKPVSERTVRIDLKEPRADGTNQIKVTVHPDGTFTVKGVKTVETDLLYGVTTEGLKNALKNLGTVG